jgi:hypothetical protein
MCGHSPGFLLAGDLGKLCTLTPLLPNLHLGAGATPSFVRRPYAAYYPKLWEKGHWNGQTIDRCTGVPPYLRVIVRRPTAVTGNRG